jgi:hypothetical protein
MSPDKSNNRQSWKPEQIAELMRLSRDNLTAQQIAVKLGRTEEAIQLQARQQGLELSKALPSTRT